MSKTKAQKKGMPKTDLDKHLCKTTLKTSKIEFFLTFKSKVLDIPIPA